MDRELYSYWPKHKINIIMTYLQLSDSGYNINSIENRAFIKVYHIFCTLTLYTLVKYLTLVYNA